MKRPEPGMDTGSSVEPRDKVSSVGAVAPTIAAFGATMADNLDSLVRSVDNMELHSVVCGESSPAVGAAGGTVGREPDISTPAKTMGRATE